MSQHNTVPEQQSKSSEWKTFLFITIILFPVLAVILVGGYGFTVWMLQLLMGPPGHG
ncbi:trimethylamine N-oxide reductase system protein TorE [Agarivorans sp. MS3-6]|uniref:trimethylamine N-oxide reductase system protein TorE n=1 Tax=Agarivorans sp. TSD2052 TaxID=2937286 RepID=UPI00200F016E|nr:trimethylamine N-oxide reductase system protein TorE [Agarivorans sp. TSD2052]UPW18451.1 trimethylamine N-oxide reductase system protein TorE [Agarivorans sp. TSD2052]